MLVDSAGSPLVHELAGLSEAVLLAPQSPLEAVPAVSDPVDPSAEVIQFIVQDLIQVSQEVSVRGHEFVWPLLKQLLGDQAQLLQVLNVLPSVALLFGVVPVLPHLPDDKPQLGDEFGEPNLARVGRANIREVDSLVVSNQWGDSAIEEVLPAQGILGCDGISEGLGTDYLREGRAGLPAGQPSQEGLLELDMSLAVEHPCLKIQDGGIPRQFG